MFGFNELDKFADRESNESLITKENNNDFHENYLFETKNNKYDILGLYNVNIYKRSKSRKRCCGCIFISFIILILLLIYIIIPIIIQDMVRFI